MKFTDEVIDYMHKSILCWLATSSLENQPNVSPKEIFTKYGESSLVIANIASPQSSKNIKTNPFVCVSFIDVLIQRGFQIKGKARVISEGEDDFSVKAKTLLEMTDGKYPFKELFFIEASSVKPIIAPSYLLYPDRTEENRIQSAKKAYGLTGDLTDKN